MNIIKKIMETYYKKKVEQNWMNLEFIPKKHLNFNIINTAIDLNYKAIQFIEKPSKELIQKALIKNPKALKYIEHNTENILLALKLNGLSLQLINKEDITLQMCIIAIKSDINSYNYVPVDIKPLLRLHFIKQESGEVKGRFLRYLTQYQHN